MPLKINHLINFVVPFLPLGNPRRVMVKVLASKETSLNPSSDFMFTFGKRINSLVSPPQLL